MPEEDTFVNAGTYALYSDLVNCSSAPCSIGTNSIGQLVPTCTWFAPPTIFSVRDFRFLSSETLF